MPNPYKDHCQIFSPKEIKRLRKGGKILHDALRAAAALIKPGVKTIELDRVAEEFIRDNNAIPGFKGHEGFPGTLCTSVNDVCVHGIPGEYELKEGDIIGMDCGVLYKDLYTDACITVAVGQISDDAQRLMVATEEALEKALAIVRAGVHVGDLSATIQGALKSYGFDAVQQLTGHGLGKTLHQFPEIPNFGEAGTGPIIPENTIVAIEPISTAGSIDITEDADKWTVRTADGALSAHFEHTVLVTGAGCEVLTC